MVVTETPPARRYGPTRIGTVAPLKAKIKGQAPDQQRLNRSKIAYLTRFIPFAHAMPIDILIAALGAA
jgi:hypothetical protein